MSERELLLREIYSKFRAPQVAYSYDPAMSYRITCAGRIYLHELLKRFPHLRILYNNDSLSRLMTIQEKVNADLKEAMKAQDKQKMSTLRVLIGEFNREIEKHGKVLPDAVSLQVIKKTAASVKELLKTQENPDVSEVLILQAYLPTELTKEQLEPIIDLIITNTGVTTVREMGKVMAELKRLDHQFDGKVASDLIKAKLA